MKDLAIRRLSCSMARILAFAAVLFCMACNVFAKGDRRDDEGHLLVMEWKEYREAEEKARAADTFAAFMSLFLPWEK